MCVEGYVFDCFLGFIFILSMGCINKACQCVPRRGKRPEACFPRVVVLTVPRPKKIPFIRPIVYTAFEKIQSFLPLWLIFLA